MKKIITSCVAALLLSGPAAWAAEDFLTDPGKLSPSDRLGGDLLYYPDDILARLPKYDSLMVDEPVIFIANDSKYKGFKASDLSAISDMLRKAFAKGLTSQPVSFGNYRMVDEPGPNVLYVRLALKDLYVDKEKRGLLSYTPVGMVAHGVADIASDVIDKTHLIELKVEAEMQDSSTGEVLFAAVLERGHRRDKKAHQKKEEAGWDITGDVAEKLGRRLACSLDNARVAAGDQVDCVKAVPIEH